jgi:DNA-binding CsgD family transcriptional regulator
VVTQATPLVGRDADLGRLVGVLMQAEEGAGSIVLISGEAGIGKTRLCAELRRFHRQRGGRVLLGRAAPEDASLPYAALADTMRAARRAEPAVWAAARARAGILWAVAPELASEASGPERSADRPVLFEALLDAVDEAAGDGTVLWVLDDIHWADDSTWEFVGYAARRVADLALVLAVTYREEEVGPADPWWPGLVRLKREPAALSLPLARLTAADGERIVRAIGPALPPETVAEIIERGAGTPLLVEELATLASGPGHLPLVPDVVRATVRERAGRLDPAGRALLEAAAVAGLEVDAGLLASVLPEGRPGDLVSVGLLDREEERFRFRHPLLQEAAYLEVPAERRQALHEQIATAMAKDDGHAAEQVAAHLERAGRAEAALSVLETAAGEANRASRVGRAATLHLGALELANRHRTLAGQRARLQGAAIRDLFLASRWSDLDPLIRQAWAGRDRLTYPARAWLAAVAGFHLFWTGAIRQAWELVEHEVENLDQDAESDEAGVLLSTAALIAWLKGEPEAARAFVDRGLAIARDTGDLELEIRARRTEIVVAYGGGQDLQIAVARLRELAEFARMHGHGAAEGSALSYLSFITSAPEDAELARMLTERTGVLSWMAALQEATIHLVEGRRSQCEAIFRQIRREIRPGVSTVAAWVDAKEACLFLHRGDLDEARQLLDGPSATTDSCRYGFIGAEWSAARGWLSWEESRFPEADVHLADAGAKSVMRAYSTMSSGPRLLPLRVDALLRLGQSEEAAAAISGTGAFNLGHDRFLVAALAAARFRLCPTPDRALAAETLTAAAPWPWLQALVGCWRGEFLQDAIAAEGARRRFEEIGAYRGVGRAETTLGRLGARLPRERAFDALSPREIEVAELVAEGLSNPAIARRLYLSRPTVASHVAHILTKLGFSSRAQIAAWVGQRRTAAP